MSRELDVAPVVHNIYLLVASEVGLIGAFLYFGIPLSLMVRGVRVSRAARAEGPGPIAGSVVSLRETALRASAFLPIHEPWSSFVAWSSENRPFGAAVGPGLALAPLITALISSILVFLAADLFEPSLRKVEVASLYWLLLGCLAGTIARRPPETEAAAPGPLR
jgi:uncharacterized membrane protein YeaQ/YmgE (transglycosylase-associated protein family)